MKTTNGMIVALAAAGLLLAGLAVGADDPVTAVSEEVSLNTRSISAVAVETDQDLDTRSHTEAYSPPRKLSTKKIVGTMLLVK